MLPESTKPQRLGRSSAVLVVITAMSAAAVGVEAQSARSVVTGPTCRACRIELTRTVTLRPPDGQAGYSAWSRVVRDSRGRIYVANEGQSDIEVYDSAGVYRESIGRRGQGPGEYASISSLSVLPGDTLLVGDHMNRRLTHLSPTGRAVRTTPFQLIGTRRLIPRPGNGFLANANLSRRGQIGQPLHMVDAKGVITRSFGAEGSNYRPDEEIMLSRPIAFLGATLWTSYASQYVLEAFDTSGKRVSVIERRADWFDPWTRGRAPSHDAPPYPRVHQLHTDGRYLWVLLNRPGHRWRDAFVPAQGTGTPLLTGRIDWYYNTTIEVFDPGSHQLLASRSLQELITGFADSTHVVIYREDADGTPHIDLWRIHLQRA